MCIACSSFVPDRRRFRSLAAAGVAAASVLGARSAFAAGATTSVTPDEALARLKAGNEKYVAAPQVCAVDLLKHREDVAKGQTPWAAILSCADSRVPPELLFGGLGVGELFIARNAGNMADTATMGTIEYGVEHLGVPLVVVMGHERCGAVAAACEWCRSTRNFRARSARWSMRSCRRPRPSMASRATSSTTPCAESAKRTTAKIATKSEIVSHFIKDNKVKVLAARYDLDDGWVEFLT
jgi:carbonic anhydrase